MTDPLTYKSTGVDLDAAERAKQSLKALVSDTRDENTLSELGAFGGLYRVPSDVDEPVLVSSADGVGTKLKVAFAAGRHHTVGQDLVNHCVNDILVQGARPLFFLDYLATGELDEGIVPEVVRGVSLACRENGCALLGGETAQMPDFYGEGEYDLAGFIVGVVARNRLIDGAGIEPGDRLLALPSSGLHTNGYTLARAILFEHMGLGPDDPFPGTGESVADTLLKVHRSYLRVIQPLLASGLVKAMAHITGGGIEGNLPRVLPAGVGAVIDADSWEPPAVFRTLAEGGNVDPGEMFRVFNMGVGLILAVAPGDEHTALEHLGGEAWSVGHVGPGEGVEFSGSFRM
ncbi:MAG: phosphoribosylformylglycinamidine cyclo-ligase [Gemmatimonadota bacterium]|nr:phosphoribosylformylglycinamidine cyclo-ligase [Gemmatimonadota bacterium]